jgi:hypothetical protein
MCGPLVSLSKDVMQRTRTSLIEATRIAHLPANIARVHELNGSAANSSDISQTDPHRGRLAEEISTMSSIDEIKTTTTTARGDTTHDGRANEAGFSSMSGRLNTHTPSAVHPPRSMRDKELTRSVSRPAGILRIPSERARTHARTHARTARRPGYSRHATQSWNRHPTAPVGQKHAATNNLQNSLRIFLELPRAFQNGAQRPSAVYNKDVPSTS